VKHDQQLRGPAFDDMTSPAALIGIDWGTTSFRAYRIGGGGQVLESRRAEAGILKISHGDFEGVFEREVAPWLRDQPHLPVIASGMITSRQGWVEVPYCPCPAGREEIARALLQHATTRGRIIQFVPGLSIVGSDGVPDVIRGEETQIIGEVGGAPGCRLLLLPGTHSKWALVEDGRIVWFATFMTGELFGVLKEHSILGRLMAGDAHDARAFRRGVVYARGERGGLLKRLFSGRTLGLFGQLPAEAIASYLSGLLIGTEVGEALDCLEQAPVEQEVTVIGSSDLTERYMTAIEGAGLRGRQAAADAAARGLFLIAAAAGHL
jgi:2-dehydro-3-deoxygalactonokinase